MKATVVAVHGLWMRGASMRLLLRRLEADGFATHIFSYPSVTRNLSTNAAALAKFLASVPGETIHLLGHSLGGLLIGAMLEKHAPERLGRVVCLGSPFQGSLTASRVARWPGGARLIGKSMSEVLARGAFGAWRAGHEVGIIAGGLPLGFGRLFGALGQPSDGTVAIAETMLADANDHIVLPVGHTALLWSAEVARQVGHFFRFGAFRRAAADR